MVLSQVNDDRDEHWEGLVFVGLQNIQEIIILEETHGSVSYLKMSAANASNNSLEKLGNQMIHLLNFAYFQDFLQLSEEQSLFHAVGKRPVLKKTFQKRNG
jgi:hypothetical protein